MGNDDLKSRTGVRRSGSIRFSRIFKGRGPNDDQGLKRFFVLRSRSRCALSIMRKGGLDHRFGHLRVYVTILFINLGSILNPPWVPAFAGKTIAVRERRWQKEKDEGKTVKTVQSVIPSSPPFVSPRDRGAIPGRRKGYPYTGS
ncbi:hypothetical protein [Desulfoluna sp.]|uniref:hypothetical protein n=1 Tax=Desulfoluna sp. TaxID=2045199 RepID=UPI002614BD1D|nr:hypothetical protein [Desulfoluna sp.]